MIHLLIYKNSLKPLNFIVFVFVFCFRVSHKKIVTRTEMQNTKVSPLGYAIFNILFLINIIRAFWLPTIGTYHNDIPQWTYLVQDRHEMASILYHYSNILYYSKPYHYNILNQTERVTPIKIKGYNAGFISAKDAANPKMLAIRLIQFMQIWSQARKPSYGTYERIRIYSNNLIAFIDQSLIHSRQITLGNLQVVQQSINYLFPHIKDASFFYDVIYFKPYTNWMSHGVLQHKERLGSGAQADVIKVYNISNTKIIYALKIFKQNEGCQREEFIMHRIHRKIHDENLKIPRIFGKHCKNTETMLIEYIDGTVIWRNKLTPEKAKIALKQLSNTIIKLGSIGIGHFDLNEGNILEDEFGNFWLIDFGFAIQTYDIINTSLAKKIYPIIGCIAFLSPHTMELNKVINQDINQTDANIITQMIINGNLYSLQAVVSWNMLNNTDPTKRQIAKYADSIRIDGLRKFSLLSAKVLGYLNHMWRLHKQLVNRHNFDDGVLKEEMFILVMKYDDDDKYHDYLDENYDETNELEFLLEIESMSDVSSLPPPCWYDCQCLVM